MTDYRALISNIPTLSGRALRIVELEHDITADLKQIRLDVVRQMSLSGMSMRQIGDAFGVSRARAHQMVHESQPAVA